MWLKAQPHRGWHKGVYHRGHLHIPPLLPECGMPNIAIANISIMLFSDCLDTLFQKFTVIISTLQHAHLMYGDLVELDKTL